ncbi:hypothetical protein PENTCL1PPCAC_14290, partial [Pristionchus entomophagus]
SLMCIIRKCGELALKTNDSKGERDVRVENLILTPARYLTIMTNVNIAKNALIEFANFAFEAFRVLECSCKNLMLESSFTTMNILESTYRACRHFPEACHFRTPGYTTYLRYTDLKRLFDNCADVVDKNSMTRELEKHYVELSRLVRQHFETCNPTDVEFAAIFGLALWSDEIINNDANLHQIATVIRSEILKELHVYYATSGTTDYASRIGHIFCLLVNCQVTNY